MTIESFDDKKQANIETAKEVMEKLDSDDIT